MLFLHKIQHYIFGQSHDELFDDDNMQSELFSCMLETVTMPCLKYKANQSLSFNMTM
jgi:hypothetical protein